MPIAAVDFETFYSSEVTIVELGIYHYLRHPQSDIYLVSIATDTGVTYVGHPKDFDWSSIAGPEWTWLSHNAQFDQPVFERLQELEVGNTCSVTELAAWHDTADLTAFLSFPRSLKSASLYLLGQEISKDTRDKMKGQRWESMSPEFRSEVEQYAIKDAVNCLNIWLKHSHKWPEHEREISAMTRSMALRGVPLDLPGLEKDLEKLQLDMWDLRRVIPWKDEPHRNATKRRKGETMALLSPIALREACLAHGLEAPGSFAQDDPEAEAFFEEYGVKYPWVGAVRDYRKAGKHQATLATMLSRARPDGWMGYGLKYGGAHTGRDAGDNPNMQNLPKGLVSGVDVRAKIKAPEGYTFAIVDLSQIEPRCLHWLSEDWSTLQYIRAIPDLYEAQARAWGLYSKPGALREEDKDLRSTIKALALGLGYGMGSNKFATVVDIEPEKALYLTKLYRSKNEPVTRLWRKLEKGMSLVAHSKDEDKNYEVVLPSGRALTYRNVTIVGGKLQAHIPRMGKLAQLKFWGGVLTENLVQATARDVFMHQCLEIEKAGIPVIMRVHDEAVCLVKKEEAEEKLAQVISIMSTAPEWAEGLPLAAEGGLSDTYKK